MDFIVYIFFEPICCIKNQYTPFREWIPLLTVNNIVHLWSISKLHIRLWFLSFKWLTIVSIKYIFWGCETKRQSVQRKQFNWKEKGYFFYVEIFLLEFRSFSFFLLVCFVFLWLLSSHCLMFWSHLCWKIKFSIQASTSHKSYHWNFHFCALESHSGR